MQVKAEQKFILMSPLKLREVAFLIKGMKPMKAFEVLPFIKKAASEKLRKVIGTALANAKQANLNPNELIFKELMIGEGPRQKRWRAGARGRSKPYVRKMSHIRVVLTTKSEVLSTKSLPDRQAGEIDSDVTSAESKIAEKKDVK